MTLAGWIAVIVGVIVAGLVALVWLARDPYSRRLRFGVFVERELEEPDIDDD